MPVAHALFRFGPLSRTVSARSSHWVILASDAESFCGSLENASMGFSGDSDARFFSRFAERASRLGIFWAGHTEF